MSSDTAGYRTVLWSEVFSDESRIDSTKKLLIAVPNSSPAPAATQASVPTAGICAGVTAALAGIGCRRS
ncbi:MAG TPA: hypothetical protein O0X38_07405 [Methanocorpusculum sp.]|nr:hypothetical protein [Methanocorpusculum sp.]